MTLKEETTCIATPNFGGFVPALKYQFGLTYGNATRHILQTDPSLKQGRIQQEIAHRRETKRADRAAASPSAVPHGGGSNEEYIWKRGNKYATGDDRFSFPPVPGYTGYIPRSQEHFGRPYVETTNASLADFECMLRSRCELPPRVKAIQDQGKTAIASHPRSGRGGSEGGGRVGESAPGAAGRGTKKSSAPGWAGSAMGRVPGTSAIPTFAYSARSASIDERSPYKREPDDPERTFVSGYTGFVPRLQNHFGESYSESVRKAIDEFTTPQSTRDPYKEPYKQVKVRAPNKTQPIPGFTGFIPGGKYGFATTFGKTTEIAYENFNNRDERGKIANLQNCQIPFKQLSQSQPIPGYRGHIPNYIFAAERSYGISSKECLELFENQKKNNAVTAV
ncbi:hypothetical protein DFJ73DRAFT_762116 [Zopfochytrium polystomum]|nr:hypothetical protein DFJ73DRAFT_762116 [Zopfochytrium polystomum]